MYPLEPCPFCEPEKHRIWFHNDLGFVLWDAYPVSKGHALVVTKEHITSIYELPLEAQKELWQLVFEARIRLQKEYQPDGFNIGINDGVAAGQTIEHAHIHIIPRWTNDVPDPRGGIRWVVTEKAKYWGGE